jgi:flagellar hook protein FlgE
MNISTNISSIGAHQTMMNNNANNVANVNADGFIPGDTKISNEGEAVVANTRMADDTMSEKSQTDLAKELPEQIVIEDVTQANAVAIKTQDEILGSLIDIKA